MTRIEVKRQNKYHAKRTWSELCQRWFDSKLEAERGEQLRYMELAGEITDLSFQLLFPLCKSPKITYKADFSYYDKDKHYVVEDCKGYLTRDSRTRIAWVAEKYGVIVNIIR